MNNRYDNSSQRYSQTGYATPEFENNNQYNSRARKGFADSLESQFYYESPSATFNKEDDYAPNSYAYEQEKAQADYNVYDSASYREAAREATLNERYAENNARQREYYSEDNSMDYTTEDSYPSQTTMQFSDKELRANPFEDFRPKNEDAIDKQYKINTKGKVLIAVYALVVATVFALIILNTRLLKTMNASYVEKQQQVELLQEEVTSLNARLEYVSSDAVIEDKAANQLGMVKADK